jgi:large subunit ribosomal protein L3
VHCQQHREDIEMVKALIGKKIGMTQVFDEAGRRIPVTVLQVGPCAVTQVKSAETDRVAAVQIGFGVRKRKNTPGALLGHLEQAGAGLKRMLRDVAPDGQELPAPGQELKVGLFEGVKHVDVIGLSKGRGFAGSTKRHHFHGAPETHGGRFGRGSGSIGSNSSPGRVVKGKRMAGHMGASQVTMRNLEVVEVDSERDLLLVKGSVPGGNGGYVMVRKAVMTASMKK